MKTLYVSDLDGTLLRSDISLSKYTCETINALAARGMLFSYATARSYSTASKVTKGLDAKIPLIVYNGAFVIDNALQTVQNRSTASLRRCLDLLSRADGELKSTSADPWQLQERLSVELMTELRRRGN